MSERRSHSGASSARYVVERTLGRGGMATVYLARDRMLDRPVALKILAEHLAEDQAFRDRFLREARLAARFVHPNVVQVYDVGEDERGPFIVMELVEGDTLADELRRRGRLPAADVVDAGIQLCAALEAAHAASLVHRDIKPQNILRRPDGQLKIADFGIARSLTATRNTEHGTVLGTAAYLAPEQARGEAVTAAADLYSLGVVLYELLTGQTPFSAETLPELLLKREQGLVVLPGELAPEVPPALESVVMRCLAPRPEHRPASAAALARELADSTVDQVTETLPVPTLLLATRVPPATSPSTSGRRAPARGRKRRPLAILAGAAALLALAAILAVAFADSGATQKSRKSATQPSATAPPTSHTTTAAATAGAPSTTTRSTATTSRQTSAPTPSERAIANARAAIAEAETAGQIDSSAAADLDRRLDAIANGLRHPNAKSAAHKVADLQRRLGELKQAGQLTSSGLTRISAPLGGLIAYPAAESRPNESRPNGPRAHGHHGRRNGNQDDGND